MHVIGRIIDITSSCQSGDAEACVGYRGPEPGVADSALSGAVSNTGVRVSRVPDARNGCPGNRVGTLVMHHNAYMGIPPPAAVRLCRCSEPCNMQGIGLLGSSTCSVAER